MSRWLLSPLTTTSSPIDKIQQSGVGQDKMYKDTFGGEMIT